MTRIYTDTKEHACPPLAGIYTDKKNEDMGKLEYEEIIYQKVYRKNSIIEKLSLVERKRLKFFIMANKSECMSRIL